MFYVKDVVEHLSGAKYFCRLDLTQAFHQLPLAESSRDLTTFYGPDGTKWRYKVLPMGLSVSPAILQSCMQNEILNGLVDNICLAYQDDCLLWADSIEQLTDRLRSVFERFRQHNITVSAKKCALFQRKITFLGRVISEEGVAIDPGRLADIRNFPRPTNKSEVRSFLGTCGFLRQHVPDFATIAEPLSALTAVDKLFVWTDACEASFNQLKAAFEQEPAVLAFPDFNLPFRVMCDASDVGLGAMLFQTQQGVDRLVAAHSRLLLPAERNYTVTEKECLAIVFSTEKFREYLLGAPFVLETDHKALLWLQTLKEPSKRIWRWIEQLSDFQFEIIHRPGRLMYADGLSRAQQGDTEPGYLLDAAASNALTVASLAIAEDFRLDPVMLRNDQLDDPEFGPVLRHLESDTPLPADLSPAATAFLNSFRDRVSIDEDGVFYVTVADRLFPRRCVILPAKHVDHVLSVAHEAPVSGHLGRMKTLERVRDYFWFPRCYSITRRFCRSCVVCARRKATNQSTTVPLVPIRHADAPFSLVAMDIVGPIVPPSSKGHRWILTFHDAFTKLLVAYPLRSTTAQTIVAHIDRFITDFDIPDTLLSDRGTNVDSALVHSFCASMGIRKIRSSRFNSRGNSLVERSHRVMSDMIATCLESSNPRSWDVALLHALRAYKTSKHEATGFSAHELVFGFPAKTSIKLLAGPNAGPLDSPSGTPAQQLNDKRNRLQALWQSASSGLDKAQTRRRLQNDRHANRSVYKVGDAVGLVIEDRSGKFTNRHDGPYIVREVNPAINDYRISKPGCPDDLLPWVNRRKLVTFPAVADVVQPDSSVSVPAPPEPYVRSKVGEEPGRLRPARALRQPQRFGSVNAISVLKLAFSAVEILRRLKNRQQ